MSISGLLGISYKLMRNEDQESREFRISIPSKHLSNV